MGVSNNTKNIDVDERISELVILYLKDCIANGGGDWEVYRKLRDAEIFIYRSKRRTWPLGIPGEVP